MCSDNVQCQLSNQCFRVKCIIENIQISDADVRATIASIQLENTSTRLHNDFEQTIALFFPTYMVKIKRKEKRPVSNVLATTERKERKVRYGVDLRDHNYKYYTMLKIFQLYELCT